MPLDFLLTVFLNPYSSYVELLTTHSCTMKVADTSVIHTTLSCCIVPSPPAKPSWWSVLCVPIFWTAVNLTRLLTQHWAPWTARVRVNVSHTSTSFMSSWEDTCFTTTDTTFPHGFWDSTLGLYTTPLYSTLTTRPQRHTYQPATSEGAVQDLHVCSIWTVLECMCE